MRARNIIISFVVITIFHFTCSNDDKITNTDSFLVKGKVAVGSQPLASAEVQIDNILNWRTTTDENGNFEIPNVTNGEHQFKINKTMNNGQSVSQQTKINVNSETTDLGEIMLPIPPLMYDIDSSIVTQISVPLLWSRCSDLDFREYKLYRKDNPGLDETTGELIFVSTSRTDTSFIDHTFIPGIIYYYRVYVLSAYGKMGGSNLVNIQTPLKNFIQNGDFEQTLDGMNPENWQFIYNPNQGFAGQFSLDSIEVNQGKYSLKATRNSQDNGDAFISQQISYTDLNVGSNYRISVKMKSEQSVLLGFILVARANGQQIFPTYSNNNYSTEWTEVSATFRMAENMTNLELRLWIGEIAESELSGWFDNVSLILNN